MGASLLEHWARVLIITVIDPELEAVLQTFGIKRKDFKKIQLKDNLPISHWQKPISYWQKQVPLRDKRDNKFYDVIITSFGEAGNVNAGIQTCRFIREWRPDALLLVGIAGAGTRSKPGDIVIGKEIRYYALGKVITKGVQPQYEISQADERLLDELNHIDDSRWQSAFKKIVKTLDCRNIDWQLYFKNIKKPLQDLVIPIIYKKVITSIVPSLEKVLNQINDPDWQSYFKTITEEDWRKIEKIDWKDEIKKIIQDSKTNSIIKLAVPKIHKALIASGEQVIASEKRREEITDHDRNIRAIAMEDYGVYEAAKIWNPPIPCLSIRGISDWADDNKNDLWDDIWQPYAARMAASFAKYYLSNAPIECKRIMESVHRQELDQKQIDEHNKNLNQHYEDITKSLENGNLIFFLGAGINLYGNFSYSSDYSTVRKDLASEIQINEYLHKFYNNENLMGFPCVVCHEPLAHRPMECPIRDKYGQSPEGEDCPLFRIQKLEIAKNVNRYLSQYEHSYNPNVHINASNFILKHNEKNFNEIHDFIAKYFTCDRRKNKSTPNLIVTTNYDCALENAFEKAFENKEQKFYVILYVANRTSLNSGKFVYKCSDEDQYKPFENLNNIDNNKRNEAQNKYKEIFNKYPVIIKLFGSVEENSIDSDENFPGIVLTEEDHINYLRHKGKVIPLEQLLPSCIKEALSQKNILFLGYNPIDEDLRVILNRLCGQERKSSKQKKGAPEGWLIHQSKLGCFETKFWNDWNIKPKTFPLEIYISNLRRRRIKKPHLK